MQAYQSSVLDLVQFKFTAGKTVLRVKRFLSASCQFQLDLRRIEPIVGFCGLALVSDVVLEGFDCHGQILEERLYKKRKLDD